MQTSLAQLIISCKHPYQPNCINGCEQNVVSKHAKRFPAISSPSIDSAAKNPHRVKNQEGRVWYGKCHDKATPNTNKPSNQLGSKASRMAAPIILYPLNYTRYNIDQRVLPTV